MSFDIQELSNANILSRREFLKLTGLGLTGLLFPPPGKAEIFSRKGLDSWLTQHPSAMVAGLERGFLTTRGNPYQEPFRHGRIIESQVPIFDIPSFDGRRVKIHWKDSVVPITGVTVGDDLPEHNRVWYQVGEEGYAHSGAIQPVRTVLNDPIYEIPQGGALAEVTVPYTDARWTPGYNQLVAYRFYYETTYWVIKLVYSVDGVPWYAILDDKWEFVFYVLAQHLRLIPHDELVPHSPEIPDPLKRLEVLNEAQVVIAYELDEPVFMARVATGAKFRDGDFSTRSGRYLTFHKRPSRHMAAGNLAYNGYDLPGVPWICYITESGISFHGTYWHNNYGRPRSHGCINLTPQAAKWVYRWTQPYVPPNEQRVYEVTGTAVDVIG